MESILNNFNIEDQVFSSLEPLIPESISKLICKYIHNVLSPNKLQYLVIEGILDHIIGNKSKMQMAIEDQLLLYMRDKDGISKSRVIQALKIEFTFLDR